MKLRLECYDEELDAAMAAIRSAFQVTKVSKPYPNMRQTSSSIVPCESRYYIDVRCPEGDMTPDLMAADMFRFLGLLSRLAPVDTDAEIGRMRLFYDAAPHMDNAQRFALLSEWRAALLERCFKRGGVTHA